ncbi:MAG: hypothetical protein GXP48_09670 [Acidobacteria bacterium]|nr:hypothetical protein [Acidobacteriota bacterium]
MAFKYLRDNLKHLKWVLWFVVFVFVMLVFVDWGTGRRQKSTAGAAVRVGNHKISEREFLRNVRDTERRFERMYGKQWPQIQKRINVAQQAAQQLIQRQLLLDEARRAGLTVSTKELRQKILSFPIFRRKDGSFVGEKLYARILRANESTPDMFEANLKDDILLQKLQDLVMQGVYVSDKEVVDELRRTKETADFDLIDVGIDPYLKTESASDAEVKAYYDSHKNDFKHPEQRVIRYLVVDTNQLRRLMPVSEQQIKKYYDEHKADFRQPEQAHAAHILIQVPPGASPEAVARAKAKADGIAKIARSGADFAMLARKFSQDPGSKSKGGDLGWFGRKRMVKVFADAVFSHKPGDIVGPIKSQFGYHIIKVEGFKPARQKTLDEVKDQIKFQLLESSAAAEAETRATALARKIREQKPTTDAAWQKIADADPVVNLDVTPPFTKGQVIPGIGRNPELVKTIFAAKVDDIGGSVPIARGWIVWQLKKIIPPGVPPLKSIQSQVAAAVVRQKAEKDAQNQAAAIGAAWRGGADPAALAKKAGSRVIPVRQHRWGVAIPGIGVSDTLDHAVFAANAGQVIAPVDLGTHGAAAVKVLTVKRLTPEEIAASKAKVRQRLQAERANALLGAILEERQKNTVIAVDNAVIQRFAPKGNKG